jgi:FkbM family methyltransferase
MSARGEGSCDMNINGEKTIQKQFLKAFENSRDKLVIFDIGANIGDWTCMLGKEALRLKIYSRIEVHAFEPVPSTFQTLQENIAKNKFSDIAHFVPEALSNEEGVTRMFIEGDNAGSNSLHEFSLKKDVRSIQIRRTTIDLYSFRNNIKFIHLVKCDAEGHDMEVLLGAKRSFQEQKIGAFQFEYSSLWVYSRHYLKDVFDYFKGSPYVIGKITPHGLELHDQWNDNLERFYGCNYLILHKETRHWFQTRKMEWDAYNTLTVSS